MLTIDQINSLKINGYLHIKSAVEESILLDAQTNINRWRHELLTGNRKLSGSESLGICHYCHGYKKTESMQKLREISLGYADFLLGWENVHEYGGAIMGWPPAFKNCNVRQAWHVDGVDKVLNSPPPHRFPGYQLVVGFPLVNMEDQQSGGLVVWPGQHNYIAGFFKESEDIKASLERISFEMYSTYPPGEHRHLNERRGDLVLFNGLLPHGTAINKSPYFADKVYFRFGHLSPEMRYGLPLCREPWLNWSFNG